jgi:predicted O-methyltransferase YrrM
MEHYYQNIQGWFDFQNIYTDMIDKAKDDYNFVEVGSWLGKSSSYMGVEIKKSGKKIKFDCIDLWEFTGDDAFYKEYFEKLGNVYSVFLENMNKSNVSDIINPIKLDSVSASNKYQDNSIDFIFIDANHNYEFIKKDIVR